MNAERLHAIVKILKSEMDGRSMLGTMQNLVQGLRSVVQQSNANTQQNLASYLTNMYQVLDNSEVDRFSPAWKQNLKETGGEDLFGVALKQKSKPLLRETK